YISPCEPYSHNKTSPRLLVSDLCLPYPLIFAFLRPLLLQPGVPLSTTDLTNHTLAQGFEPYSLLKHKMHDYHNPINPPSQPLKMKFQQQELYYQTHYRDSHDLYNL